MFPSKRKHPAFSADQLKIHERIRQTLTEAPRLGGNRASAGATLRSPRRGPFEHVRHGLRVRLQGQPTGRKTTSAAAPQRTLYA